MFLSRLPFHPLDSGTEKVSFSFTHNLDLLSFVKVEMYRSTGDNNIRPNTISYNTVINAWSKSGCDIAADMAEKILEKMIEEWKSEKNEESLEIKSYRIKPDAVSFTR